MISPAANLKLTYEDYLYFPEDGRRHELVDGEHFATPAPIPKHQAVVLRLTFHLAGHVLKTGAGELFTGPIDVVLSEVDVVQPDLLFLSKERLDQISGTRIDGAPDLMVEVLSESTRKRDEIAKRHLYEKHGIREYWVVDPELETCKIYRRSGSTFGDKIELSAEAGDRLTTPLLPNWSLDLEDVFAWGMEAL